MIKKYISRLLLLVLLFSCVSPAWAESNYKMNQADLDQLIRITNKLQKLNNELSEALKESNSRLEEAKTKLAEYQIELDDLSKQLNEASADSETYKKDLEEARKLLIENNQCLEDFQKKVEREIGILKLQRNIAAGVAVLVLLLK
jgi:septal ring factor EnvC (AmiA/AmiB activator)